MFYISFPQYENVLYTQNWLVIRVLWLIRNKWKVMQASTENNLYLASVDKEEYFSHTNKRRKIRLIESNAKCLKEFTCKGVLSVWVPLPSYDPISPPPPTHCIRICSILTVLSRGGGGLYQREGYSAIVHEAGRKYQHDWLCVQSINSFKHQ